MVFNQTLAYHLNIESDLEDFFSYSNYYAALFLFSILNSIFVFIFSLPQDYFEVPQVLRFACFLISNTVCRLFFSSFFFFLYTIFYQNCHDLSEWTTCCNARILQCFTCLCSHTLQPTVAFVRFFFKCSLNFILSSHLFFSSILFRLVLFCFVFFHRQFPQHGM